LGHGEVPRGLLNMNQLILCQYRASTGLMLRALAQYWHGTGTYQLDEHKQLILCQYRASTGPVLRALAQYWPVLAGRVSQMSAHPCCTRRSKIIFWAAEKNIKKTTTTKMLFNYIYISKSFFWSPCVPKILVF